MSIRLSPPSLAAAAITFWRFSARSSESADAPIGSGFSSPERRRPPPSRLAMNESGVPRSISTVHSRELPWSRSSSTGSPVSLRAARIILSIAAGSSLLSGSVAVRLSSPPVSLERARPEASIWTLTSRPSARRPVPLASVSLMSR